MVCLLLKDGGFLGGGCAMVDDSGVPGQLFLRFRKDNLVPQSL